MSSKRAAAALRFIADVSCIAIAVAERALDRAQRADLAGANKLPRAQPLRMRAHHEGFADLHTAAVPGPRSASGTRRHSSRWASRRAHACRPAQPGSTRAHADDSAADCRSHPRPGRRAIPRRSHTPWRMPSAAAAAWALPMSREAIAATSHHSLFCIPGTTFSRAIFAAPRTPHRTLLFMQASYYYDLGEK